MRTKILAILMTGGAVTLVFAMAASAAETPMTSTASRAAASKPAGTIAFLREPPGGTFTTDQSLYVIGADGSGLRRVTPSGTPVYAYASSPSGRLIAYIDASRGSLWLVRPNGTGLRQLLPGSRLETNALSWSPDGKEIAITSSGPYTKGGITECPALRIYIVPIHGSHPRMLRRASAGCGGVAWSPRGNEIAYEASGFGHSGVSVIHPDGSGRRPVSRRGGGWMAWSADGRQLAFAVGIYRDNRIVNRYAGVAVVDANGSHLHVVTKHAYNEYPAVWSPKGRQLLYGRADNGGIYVTSTNGRNDHRVTSDAPPRSGWPALAWSPDGSSIVYATPTGNGDLYEVGVNGRGKVDLTSTPDSDLAPSWVAP